MDQANGFASSLKTGLDGEVISDASLSYGQFLTLDDPREITTASLIDDLSLDQLIMQSSIAPAISNVPAISADDKCIKILEYLNSRNLQFNSRTAFRDYLPWRQAILNCINSDKEIQIIIPIFCNIGNPMKRFSETTVTAGEKVTLRFLSNIATEIRKVHNAGCRFNVVVDANFYSTPFMNNVIETNAYFKQLSSYVAENNLTRELSIIDMMEVLSSKSTEFTNRFHDWMTKIGEEENTAVNSGWVSSMISSLNLRYLGNDLQIYNILL